MVRKLKVSLESCDGEALFLENFYINVLTMTTDGDSTKPHLLKV